MTKRKELIYSKKTPDWRFFSAPQKKFQETFVMVPFYGAKEKSLFKHIELLHELGYDVCLIDLSFNLKIFYTNPLLIVKEQGLMPLWAKQIEKTLDEIKGPKIVFSFSNPSASALVAVGKRKALEIKGMICEGGPSGLLFSSMLNYFSEIEPIKFWPLKVSLSLGSRFLWSVNYESLLFNSIASFPQNFPLLSIRGWKDTIISPKQINLVFEKHKNINWQKFNLPMAGHLNGLRDFRLEYLRALSDFLNPISNQI